MAAALAQLGKLELAKAQVEIWREWYTSRNGGPPTIKAFLSQQLQFSELPGFLKLWDITVADGLRKLGVPEE